MLKQFSQRRRDREREIGREKEYSRCNNLTFGLIRFIFIGIFLYIFVHSQNVLAIGDATWTNFGYPRWELVLCLAFGWFVAFLCLSKGIKSAGKTVFFVVIFPYVILTALLVSYNFNSCMQLHEFE